MDSLLQALRHATRALMRQRAFTLITTAVLALGIGANTAVFSVVNLVLLRPLPYDDPSQLVVVWERMARVGQDRSLVAPSNYLDWAERNEVFQSMAAYTEVFRNLQGGAGDAERIYGIAATPSFLQTLGVRPALGRTFRPEDAQVHDENAPLAVILSDGIWRRRFGASVSVVGQSLTLNGRRAEVVGVLPPVLLFSGKRIDILETLRLPTERTARLRRAYYLHVAARLRADVTIAQAQAQMDRVTAVLAEQHPDTNRDRTSHVAALGADGLPVEGEGLGPVRPALVLLQLVVALVLLIAVANVANLQLVRGVAGRRELATRAALGATRRHLVQPALLEGLLLGLAGGAVGIPISVWSKDLLLTMGPEALARLERAPLDGRVLAFALVVSLATSLVSGLLPAVFASRTRLGDALREGGKSPAGAAPLHTQRLLVVAQVALSLVLLVGAGLLIKSFVRLQRVDPGFTGAGAVAMDITLPGSHGGPEAVTQFYRQLVDRVQALPGVRSVGITDNLPFSGEESTRRFTLEGDSSVLAGETVAQHRRVSPGYFDAIGIPMRRGRQFTAGDLPDWTHAPSSPGVAIVNEGFVRRFLPAGDPVGRRMLIADGPPRWREIVGIVPDVRHGGLDAPAVPEVYVPHVDRPRSNMTLVVRSMGPDPTNLVASVRRELSALDKGIPLANVKTIERYIHDSLGRQRLSVRLLGAFAGLALVLAALGLYGVMAYTVVQRTHEIGVRMALGAAARDINRLVLRDGLRLVGAGIAIGLASALVLSRAMTRLLYEADPRDPAVLAGVTALLAGVALLACYLPARRAGRMDPMVCTRL